LPGEVGNEKGGMMNENQPIPISFTPQQRDSLKPYLAHFKTYAQSTGYQKDQEKRRNQEKFFQVEFPKRLSGLAESDILDMVSRLWAAQIWGNKQYLAHKIVAANGLEKLRDCLTNLWNTSLPASARYDEFRKQIAHLGPAALTEMMCYIEPKRCGIWNAKARQALRILKFNNVNPDQYQIPGKDYETFNSLLASIAQELSALGLERVDLLEVDFFLFEVAVELPSGADAIKSEVAPLAKAHDEIRDLIEGIGSMLGFDTDTEYPIAHGARVDVVWRARIGNLGIVKYVFEVQSSGSIDSLILNLQRAKSDPTVQKVVAVSDEPQLQKIEREVGPLHSEFRNALSFWKASEVQQVSDSLQAAMAVINRLGLAPGKPSDS
jgi:hypothetical protein